MKSDSILRNLKRFENKNKSLIYLYNIMQLDCVAPINTYFGFSNYETDTTLIALYHINQTQAKDVISKVTKCQYYGAHFIDNEGYIYVMFEFFNISSIYELIREGKYSQIPQDFKTLLRAHKDPLIEYGLYPENYFNAFADEFRFPVDSIPRYNGNELIPPPNMESEYIVAPKEVIKALEEEFDLV